MRNFPKRCKAHGGGEQLPEGATEEIDGKTVILVTHSTLQLKMCDKIVFMGAGGNFVGGICWCSTYFHFVKYDLVNRD